MVQKAKINHTNISIVEISDHWIDSLKQLFI